MSTAQREDPKEVSKFDPTWCPYQNEDGTYREMATKDDFIDCYYLGNRENQGKMKDKVVHTVKDEQGQRHSIWGNRVLNDKLMQGVTPGQFIRIRWTGMFMPERSEKNKNPKKYHTWNVGIFDDVAPLSPAQMGNGNPANWGSDTREDAPAGVNDYKVQDGPTDDLPF